MRIGRVSDSLPQAAGVKVWVGGGFAIGGPGLETARDVVMGIVSTCQIRSLTMNHILTSAKVSGLNLAPDNQTSKFQTISFHPWGLMPMTPQSTDSQVPQPIYFSLVRYSYFRSSQLSHKIHSEQPLHTVVTIHHLIHAPALPRRF